jgi:hypothetical protein
MNNSCNIEHKFIPLGGGDRIITTPLNEYFELMSSNFQECIKEIFEVLNEKISK